MFHVQKNLRALYLIHRAVESQLFDWIYPPRCPGCDRVLEGKELAFGFCRECEPEFLREPLCMKCGKPLTSTGASTRDLCRDCACGNHVFRRARGIYIYEGVMRPAMYRFKYSNRRDYARIFARHGGEMLRRWVWSNDIEVIVPVPMYEKKKRKRGYNQAEVFARALGENLGLPVVDLVERKKDTVPQKGLNAYERRENLKNAFKIKGNGVQFRHIMLVDDIYTTGSTMDHVAEVLLSQGAEDVYAVYICVGLDDR